MTKPLLVLLGAVPCLTKLFGTAVEAQHRIMGGATRSHRQRHRQTLVGMQAAACRNASHTGIRSQKHNSRMGHCARWSVLPLEREFQTQAIIVGLCDPVPDSNKHCVSRTPEARGAHTCLNQRQSQIRSKQRRFLGSHLNRPKALASLNSTQMNN